MEELLDPEQQEEVAEPTAEETPTSEAQTDETVEEQPPAEPEAVEPEVTEPDQPSPIPYKKFSKVWGERQQFKQDAEYWRQKATENEKPAEFNEPEPNYDSYDSIPEYTKDVARWERKKWEFEKQQADLNERARRITASFDEKLARGDEKYPDFHEVKFLPRASGYEHTFNAMVQILSDSDKAADIVYYFGKNQDEAARIATMDPVRAAREIGRIETKLSEAPKKISKQAAPTSPVSGKTTPPIKNEEDMSMEEWEAAWEAGKLPGSPRGG